MLALFYYHYRYLLLFFWAIASPTSYTDQPHFWTSQHRVWYSLLPCFLLEEFDNAWPGSWACHLDQSFFKVHQSLAFQISFLGWALPWTDSGRKNTTIEHLRVISIISTFSILATTHMPLSILFILSEENSPINNIHIAGQLGSGDWSQHFNYSSI